jgi:hypothetical protein
VGGSAAGGVGVVLGHPTAADDLASAARALAELGAVHERARQRAEDAAQQGQSMLLLAAAAAASAALFAYVRGR